MSDEMVVFLVFLASLGITCVLGLLFAVITAQLTKNNPENRFFPCCAGASVGLLIMLCYSMSFSLAEPTSIGGLAGAVLGYAAALFFVHKLYGKKAEEKSRDRVEKYFYLECKKYKITSRRDVESSAKNRERMKLVAAKHGIRFSELEDLCAILDKAAIFEEQSQKELEDIQKRGLEQQKNRARPAEQAEYKLLTRYAGLHGREKPLAMLKAQEKEWRSYEATRPNGAMPLKKESDGAIMAGIASGIGGTVPAVMSLAQTAKNNESVREYNQAAMAYNTLMGGRTSKTSEKYRRAQQVVSEKLIAELPGKKLMKHLTFEQTKVIVTVTGTVWVATKVTFDDKLVIFDEVPAIIDGTVIAEIYDGKQKIGAATMVFPLPGTNELTGDVNNVMKRGCFPGTGDDATYTSGWPTEWEFLTSPNQKNVAISVREIKPESCKKNTWLAGMCLFCGEQGKEYTVKFVPGDLWAMEK